MGKKRKQTKRKSTKKKSAGDKLSLKDRKFCKLFTSEREFFGNGVQAYAEAFDQDISNKRKYNVCAVLASRLLKKVNILAYINELLEGIGLNEAHVDKQLAFLITQNADYGAKMAAIREFNALRQRITKKFKGTLTFAQALHKEMSGNENS